MSEADIINDLIDKVRGERSRLYVISLLNPDDPLFMSPDERSERAEIMAALYDLGLSLTTVGRISGGLSKQRIRQILRDHGYMTRPAPGSKKWRQEKAARGA